MSKVSLLKRNVDSLTSDDMINFYVQAYETLHAERPEIKHLYANRFLVNGIERERHWLLLEIELLHQQLIATAGKADNASTIVKLVRRFQRVLSQN